MLLFGRNEIASLVDETVSRRHLLWGLVYLKEYSTEFVLCQLVRGSDNAPTPKTFREKVKNIVECIADLKDKFIVPENRFVGALDHTGGLPLLTYDCTDCMIEEPFPFDPKLKSVKFNGPGFKYGVSIIAIHSNNICLFWE